jgi:hypothetical protein
LACGSAKEASAIEIPPFDQLDHVQVVTIDNETYPIRYGFSPNPNDTARVDSMRADPDSKLIRVDISDNSSSTEKRYFTIELPRNIIDANTTQLAGGCSASSSPDSTPDWIQEHDIDYTIVVSSVDSEGDVGVYNGNQGEQCGKDSRVLSIEYLAGKSTIIIQGTAMVPEFDITYATLIITAVLVGVMILTGAIKHRTLLACCDKPKREPPQRLRT